MNRIILALAALVGQATAFAPAVAPRPATQLQASKFDAGAKAAASLAASLALAGAVLTPEAAFAATATQAGGVCAAAPDSEVCRQSTQVKAKAAATAAPAKKPAAKPTAKPKAKAPAKKKVRVGVPYCSGIYASSTPSPGDALVPPSLVPYAQAAPKAKKAAPKKKKAVWRGVDHCFPSTLVHVTTSARWRGGWRMQSPDSPANAHRHPKRRRRSRRLRRPRSAPVYTY